MAQTETLLHNSVGKFGCFTTATTQKGKFEIALSLITGHRQFNLSMNPHVGWLVGRSVVEWLFGWLVCHYFLIGRGSYAPNAAFGVLAFIKFYAKVVPKL